jgi:coenzyme Q-binding protein COQ10
MPAHSETKILPYSAKQMFDLVLNVEKYPQFLPWCLACKITKIFNEGHFEADLVINFKGLTQKYSSDIKASENINGEFIIKTTAIDGPFKKLINHWKFQDIASGCRVEFLIDFEFKSLILEKVIGVIFEKATNKMIAAFEERAKSIYTNYHN